MQPISGRQWHALPRETALAALHTSEEHGLRSSEVSERQARFGANTLSRRQAQHPFLLLLQQFHQPLVYILLASAVITTTLHEWVDAGVIYGVVIVNALIGFLQESKAVKAIEALSRELVSTTMVLREGRRQPVPSSALVPGDIVFLQPGDKVPADLRLLRAKELRIDESALTGESVPASKHADELAKDTAVIDRANMAYATCLVTSGIGTGVVVATGDATETGRINTLLAATEILSTPLTRKISRFSKRLLYIILGLAAVTFAIGMARGAEWFDMLMAAIALAVGAIPEGLPAAVTITLAIGVNKMAKRNVIIRKLPAVETLGSTTVICSDKTGTLTQNRMTVREIVADGLMYRIEDSEAPFTGIFIREGECIVPDQHPALRECLLAGALCNNALLISEADGRWRLQGDPTETALLVAAIKGGIRRETVAASLPRRDVLPFDSSVQYMATLHGEGEHLVAYLKGSVESLVPRCTHGLSDQGLVVPLQQDACVQSAAQMAAQGLRVLAFARVEFDADRGAFASTQLADGLVFLGLQGMLDPPRPEAIAAVRACRGAGIQVKMITGDHVLTAEAIARRIGLVEDNGPSSRGPVLSGMDLAALTDTQLAEAVEQTAVFARVAPEQKLRLVRALQASGHIVAMTGDGVNDAPALCQADIGVAMGSSGTEVAKEAADMLLLDDNFSSIEAAVEEGRGVFDNLVKFIAWTLPTNLGEGLVILVAVVAGLQLPILPVQILWINMTTAVLLGLMLAFEPKEEGIMERPPRDPGQPLFTRELAFTICLVSFLLLIGTFIIFQYELRNSGDLRVAQTCAVNVFVFGELFYLFNCRSLRKPSFRLDPFSNHWLVGGVLLTIVLQLLFTYAPMMQAAFHSAPMGLHAWWLVLANSAMIYVIIEGVKAWKNAQTIRRLV